MDDHQVTAVILDNEDFDWNSGLIIAENQHAVRFGWVVRRRLDEGQTAVCDGKANLVISNPMLMCGPENPDRQRSTP